MTRSNPNQFSDQVGTPEPVLNSGVPGPDPGMGPLSVRVRPSSLKHDCHRRTTSTDGKFLVSVHTKSRLTQEPLRTLRTGDKGQAGAYPGRTPPIPCKVRVGTTRMNDLRMFLPAWTTGERRTRGHERI
jgi:hypothetical protein